MTDAWFVVGLLVVALMIGVIITFWVMTLDREQTFEKHWQDDEAILKKERE